VRRAAVVLAALLALPAAAAGPAWQGHFISRGDAEGLFSPCHSGKRYSTRDATPDREVAALYEELARRPGQPIFMEFSAIREAEDALVIDRVLRAAATGPGCREDMQAFELRAHGGNPPWRLDVSPAAVLFQPGRSEPLKWPYQSFSARKGRRELAARSEAGDLLVIITPGRCLDPLVNGVFSLRAEIAFGGRTYLGCAYEGSQESAVQR
jgi:uncharacterized membrane protein